MTCAIRSLGRHDNQAFIQISHVAGPANAVKTTGLGMLFAKPRRRVLWLRQPRRRENGKKYRWGATILKRAACMPKSTHTMAPTRKTSVEVRWWRLLMTVNTVQEAVKVTRCV
jgi:hypothetical protein